ncbi:hypothetical protein GCM10011342_28300 [Aquisalinus flavus]|uniref:GIY-YIG domain-containing protein n=1 Tax=Aquisalinus flavus TaxID=1526572 RepID=A0A8J2V6G1_9PROT|nr:hypothetical protein GCM10011342_28300 [Aquisalinus flavus]
MINYDYRDRQTYPYAEKHRDLLIVSEILKEPASIESFDGYRDVNLALADLQIIIARELPDWRAALSSVKGIYLITDPENGKSYVGKADGISGFWGRFCQYANSIHGMNRGLISRIEDIGAEPALNWRITILEVVDLYADNDTVNMRESFWKNVLMTRAPFGYNLN